MRITSTAFEPDQPIPAAFTCDGDDRSPALAFHDIPDSASALALVVDDPDAPDAVWVHWLAWNIPAHVRELPPGIPSSGGVEGLHDLRQGTNDFRRQGYGGPCPPPGHGVHHYRFTLYALDRTLDLAAAATRDALERAMNGAILQRAELVGTYER